MSRKQWIGSLMLYVPLGSLLIAEMIYIPKIMLGVFAFMLWFGVAIYLVKS